MSILDTGADVTVISQVKQPPSWALKEVSQPLTGIAGSSHSYRSHHLVQVEGPECHTAFVKPFVMPAPMVLWGRDVPSQCSFKIQPVF